MALVPWGLIRHRRRYVNNALVDRGRLDFRFPTWFLMSSSVTLEWVTREKVFIWYSYRSSTIMFKVIDILVSFGRHKRRQNFIHKKTQRVNGRLFLVFELKNLIFLKSKIKVSVVSSFLVFPNPRSIQYANLRIPYFLRSTYTACQAIAVLLAVFQSLLLHVIWSWWQVSFWVSNCRGDRTFVVGL